MEKIFMLLVCSMGVGFSLLGFCMVLVYLFL